MDDDESEAPVIRTLIWLGDSKRNIQAFPSRAKKLMGQELQTVQLGSIPKHAKRFKGIGPGVIEIALRHDTDAFRSVLAVQLGKQIYVLHAFQKKSTKGIATPKKDVDLIRQRYSEARKLAKNEK